MTKRIFIVALLVALARVAAAGPSIVVESSPAERPADAGAIFAPVYEALDKRGFLVGDKLGGAIDDKIAKAAGTLSASRSADAQKLVAQGYDDFINGDYDKAIDHETQALTIYASAPATLAKESGLRDLQFKALIVAARSSEALGKGEDAFRDMAEAMRMIPDRPINASEFDPSVKALYKKVKDELVRQGAGTLEIKVDDANAVIFVDERFVGTGAVKLDGLLPGRYRVYVAKGEQPGRTREIEVPAKGHASVDVTWGIDGVLRTRPGYVGIEGAENELDSAVRVARALGASRVVVLGLRTIDGRRSIVAFAISTESQNKIYGAVQLEPVSPPPAVLEKLAALMAGDKVDATGIITKEPPPVRTRRVIGQRPSAMHKLKWVFGAGALVALGTGGALIAIDDAPQPDTPRKPDYNDTKTLGLGVAAGGLALAAVAVYMFTADHPVDVEAEVAPGVSLAPVIAPDSVGFAVAGRF
ncbi:MAG TPA: hypothetical protein VL856_02735 [Acidimicrobiia bacterium]|jgi:hypothetical protein|nr:hypothetical protein [Acidimicrobiia bacterium]